MPRSPIVGKTWKEGLERWPSERKSRSAQLDNHRHPPGGRPSAGEACGRYGASSEAGTGFPVPASEGVLRWKTGAYFSSTIFLATEKDPDFMR